MSQYAFGGEQWAVEEESQTFESPSKTKNWEQTVFFADEFRNGSIDVEVTLVRPLDDVAKREGRREATVLWRRSGDSWYYGGIGAFQTKYFVGRRQGRDWHPIERIGTHTSLEWNRVLKLRIDCNDDQITLSEGGVRLIQVSDAALEHGQWGFRTWGTVARFKIAKVVFRPKCFVIMPFAEEFEGVFAVISATLAEYGIDCVRSDNRAISAPIMDDVKKQIRNADLVLVDLTGKNPNVYYEAGLADAWGRKWIVLAQSADDVTFDMRQIRFIRYQNRMGGDTQLAANLRRAIEATTGRSALGPA
jgi:hypothetical protein